MKYMNKGAAGIQIGKDTIYYNSDKYFNDSDACDMYGEMGFDVQPVDVFGGLVPQGKSLDNIKKNERAIRTRFQLDTDK